jgi:glycosyltransferase involved in cell wall biosynthesis
LLKQRGIPFTALMAGQDLTPDQSRLKKLESLTASLNLEEHVFFTGQLAPIVGWMKACDILAVPSMAEPFGRIVIEAWAARLPIVATQAGGPSELIEHGKTGLLVPPGNSRALADALQALCEKPDQRNQLREQGWVKAESFDLSRCINRMLELYEQLI